MYIKIPPEADEHYVICTGRYFLLSKTSHTKTGLRTLKIQYFS